MEGEDNALFAAIIVQPHAMSAFAGDRWQVEIGRHLTHL
jgi:hypothetical protein